jgi:hypothetical protein
LALLAANVHPDVLMLLGTLMAPPWLVAVAGPGAIAEAVALAELLKKSHAAVPVSENVPEAASAPPAARA